MKQSFAETRAIVHASRSNLALAFVALPRERRSDIMTFYAWCRLIDDIADSSTATCDQRRDALGLWQRALRGPVSGEAALAASIREVMDKYAVDVAHFDEIIAGVEMDLAGLRYETWEALKVYCHRVASVVGLISIKIFGCQDPQAAEYASVLGLALQLTNILRDVGEDFRNGGRVYLPREDLDRFGYPAENLALELHNPAFLALMNFEAKRARDLFSGAAALLPASDRRALVAAEIMRAIYRRLLERMTADNFQVFRQRYALGRLTKLGVIASSVLRAHFV